VLLLPGSRPHACHQHSGRNGFRCGQRPSVSTRLLFVLDTSYAAMLTIVPSVLLFIFNSLISRHLLIVRRSRSCMNHDVVGHQFAFLLVLVSTTFLVLTWPYYLCWVTNFIIKFNINVNFFLYSYASNYFRSEMKQNVLTVRLRREQPLLRTDGDSFVWREGYQQHGLLVQDGLPSHIALESPAPSQQRLSALLPLPSRWSQLSSSATRQFRMSFKPRLLNTLRICLVQASCRDSW
uniref:G_PROTEIN_RECEP_F1_2 domain-containing protein n=1 Tax=Macrostomum lignano TaxID=282301 RepID=A0A1I8IV98_9PLAT